VGVSAEDVAKLVVEKLRPHLPRLKEEWHRSKPVKHVVVDGLLPDDLLRDVVQELPSPETMRVTDSIRERKRTSARPDTFGPTCRAAIDGLHAPAVLRAFSEISSIDKLTGDGTYYAGGISYMNRGDFLNPHIDNSGHPSMLGYRRLNALYYVSPDWTLENGGNLELWTADMDERVEVVSSFNRLVLMNTNRKSLHSVNPVAVDRGRWCLSNYYYTRESPDGRDYFHITSFRGRPEQPLRDLYCRLEGKIGSALIKVLPGLAPRG